MTNERKQVDMELNRAYTNKLNTLKEHGLFSWEAKIANKAFKGAIENANKTYGYTRYN